VAAQSIQPTLFPRKNDPANRAHIILNQTQRSKLQGLAPILSLEPDMLEQKS
jgi:hypothetical protein